MTIARMSLSDILWLYRARLRARAVLVQECFAIVGIAVGVALLFASQVASTSLTHSVSQLNSQLVGNTQFQLDARGPGGFDERLLSAARHIPGVQIALPVLEQQVNVIGPGGAQRSVDLIGTDPRFAHFAGTLLRRFSAKQLAAQRAIALPAPLAAEIGAGPLETIKLQIGASVAPTLLGATLGETDIGGLVHSPVALAPVGYAQHLTGMSGKITRIFVQSKPGRKREVLGGLVKLAATAPVNVEPSNFDSALFGVAVAPESQSETLFSAISALVGFMFALNAMLVTVPSRRKLIADIRPQGATRFMTVQILLFDAAVLGVLACILGLVLGEALSVALFHAVPGYLSFAFPVGNQRIVTWSSVALAVGAGLTAAVAGVLWPLRDILAQPLDGNRSALRHNRRWIQTRLVVGLLCLAGTTSILVAHPQSGFIGIVTLVVALVCLLPLLFDGLVTFFERTQRGLNGAATVLAVTELQTRETRVRSLAIAATAAIAVFGTVEFQGTQSNLQRGLDISAHQLDASADLWVTPKGESNAFATTPFKNLDSSKLDHLPGVDAVGLYRGSFLNWGNRRLWVVAPPRSTIQPVPPSQIVSGSIPLATNRIRASGWAVLSRALASAQHLKIGQIFTLPSPRPIRLRVAALITNLGWPPGAIILNASDYARAWASNDPSAYMIDTRPGVSLASERRLVQRSLGAESGLAVETSTEREQRHYALASQGLSRLTQIRLLVLIAAVLAVAGAMGSMIWQRRDLVSFIKCQGYRKGVLWRWLLCESAVLLAAGSSIGAVFGLLAQLLASHFLASVTGFPVAFDIEAFAAFSSFALLTVVAVAMVALPGYLVVRVPPRTASPAF
jgi:putative ABC transport system permease protein